MASAPSSLERRLGPYDAAAIIVSNVIGGGILFLSPAVAASVPNAFWFLAIWAAGGALAFAGAMAYAELASVRPRAGGEYQYLYAAYGPLAAFLTGWTSFVAGFTGAIASNAAILAFYLGRFIPWASIDAAYFVIPLPWVSLTISPQTITAVAAIWLMSWVHLRGVGPGRVVSNVLAVLKVGAFLVFIILGFSFGIGAPANLTGSAGPVTINAWFFALIPIMFTYSGWNAATYVAEEVRDPGRNVAKALAVGTLAVTVIYVLMNVLYVYVIPIGELARMEGSILDVVGDRLLGTAAGNVMGVVSIIGLLAGISGNTFAGSRVYYAMARDGLFFRAAADIHPTYRTPANAIVAQAVWSTLLVLSGGASALAAYTGFTVVLFAGIAVTALFVLRQREPNVPRPFSALGYPVAPAIFAITSMLIVLNALWTDLGAPLTTGQPLGPSAAGLFVIALGLPLYWWFRKGPRSAR
ncbi:MAG: amino acid permease [Acidobacteria bacterium]|nr:amino acid permease [Acidobacteriota bacterium]